MKQMKMDGRSQVGAFVRPKDAAGTAPPHRFEYITINKEEAKALLARVRIQRKMDPARVAGHTRTMDLGLWDCASGRTPIGVDREGCPINGQKRLAAFVASKLDQITFLFVVGCNPEDFTTYDVDTQGRGPKFSHPSMQGSARELSRITQCDKLVSGNARIRNTHSVLEYLYQRTWSKQCAWAAVVMPNSAANGRAAYVAPLMYAHKADPGFADQIARSWANGGGGLPPLLIALRDSALRRESKSGGRAAATNIRSSLKMLNVLALLHQERPMPLRLSDSLAGLRYFSGLLRDGAARRWEDGAHLLSEED